MNRDYWLVISQLHDEIWSRAMRHAREWWRSEEERKLAERATARTEADKSALQFENDGKTVTKYGL